MAVYLQDQRNEPGRVIRTLQYSGAGELTGDHIVVADGTTAYCAPGSIAWKAGFQDLKQLDESGQWIDI